MPCLIVALLAWFLVGSQFGAGRVTGWMSKLRAPCPASMFGSFFVSGLYLIRI
jgi:hypothetical protein